MSYEGEERRQANRDALLDALRENGVSARRVATIVESHTSALADLKDALKRHDDRQIQSGILIAETATQLKSVAETVSRIGIKTDATAEDLAGVKEKVNAMSPAKQGAMSGDIMKMILTIVTIVVVGLLSLAGYNVSQP